MPKLVEPQVFLIAETKISDDLGEGMHNFLAAIGVPEWHTDAASDAECLVEVAGKSCFDDSTEILSGRGWVLFKDLLQTDQVLTLNSETNCVEWQTPTHHHAYDFSGVLVCAEGRDISFRVTSDHWLYARVGTSWGFISAGEAESTPADIKLGGVDWAGSVPSISLPPCIFIQRQANKYRISGHRLQTNEKARVLSTEAEAIALAKLLVYFVTEGTISEAGTNKRVVIYGSPHVEEVKKLCSVLGWTVCVWVDKRNGVARTTINSRQFADYAKVVCGHGSWKKRLPPWVLGLPSNILYELWEIFVATDGHVYASGSEILCTVSWVLAGQLQELLCKIGDHGSISESVGTNYPLLTVRRKRRQVAQLNKQRVFLHKESYAGRVYCVTTGNGIVYVRRNRKPHWSGNCYLSFDKSLNKNLTRTGMRTNHEYIQDQIIKTGHGSVLEHATVTLAFVNVSRVFTHELVRHRVGAAYSQVSGRYVRTDQIGYWMPKEIREDEFARGVFHDCFADIERWVGMLEKHFKIDSLSGKDGFSLKKKLTSAFRRLIGNGQANHIVATFNHRTLRHLLELRTAEGAEEEIRLVFNKVYHLVTGRYPAIYGGATTMYDADDDGLFAVKFERSKI